MRPQRRKIDFAEIYFNSNRILNFKIIVIKMIRKTSINVKVIKKEFKQITL